MTIAESLKRFRKNFGITQQQVADTLGIKQQSYQVYESKNVIPSAAVIIKLAKAFDVPSDYLLGLRDTPIKENVLLAENHTKSDFDKLNEKIEKLSAALTAQGIKID